MAHGYGTKYMHFVSVSDSLDSMCNDSRCSALPLSTKNSTPALPDGKSYHLFFSHCSEDRQWTKTCVERLEQNYGIKCIWPNRDFTPGMPIPKLIEDGMSHSMKIVIVLSPEYINNGWCCFERNLAIVQSVHDLQNCIIPVMLKPCLVPDVLKTLNYIDVTNGENVDSKIVKSLNRKSDLSDIIPNLNIVYKQKAVNGAHLSLTATKEVNSPIRGTAWAFASPSLFQHEEIENLGGEISLDSYVKAVTVVNSMFYLRILGIKSRVGILYSLMLLLSLSGMISTLFLYCLEYPDTNIVSIGFLTFPTLILVWLAVFTVFYIKVIRKEIRKCHEIVKELSLETVQHTKLLVFFNHHKVPTLTFMYYDTEPCKLHIRDCILRNDTSTETSENKELMASNKADGYIKTFLDVHYRNLHVFNWNRLDESLEKRHPTLKRKQCLCEMIEKQITY